MTLTGTGLVFPGGAGVQALLDTLTAGTPLPRTRIQKEGVDALQVPSAAFTGNPVLGPARRADRFCKMTLLAAMEAWQGCRASPERTGIILATAFGPHTTVFRFVNEILDFGDAKTSPTVFSQSVHAAAASMVTVAAGLHGPAVTLADLATPFEEALALAEGWLADARCDAVLVGAVDEISDVLSHVVRRKWPAPEGANSRTACVPGEGAVFFRLEREGGPSLSVTDPLSQDAGCLLLNKGALGGTDADIEACAEGFAHVPQLSYTAYLGSTRIGSAFHLAVARLMQREGRAFPNPALAIPNPSGSLDGRGNIQIVSTCGSRRRVITLHAANP